MQRYIFGTFLCLLHRTIYIDGISTQTYGILIGIRVSNPYRTIPFSQNSRSMCAAYCISEKTTCNSANYNDVAKTCELNIQSLLAESAFVVEDSDWIVLYIPDGKLHYCRTKIPFVLRRIGKEPSFSFSGISPLKRVAIGGMNRLYVYQMPLVAVIVW